MPNRHPEYKTTNKIKNMAESVEGFEFSLQETLKDLSKNGKQIDLKLEQGAAIKSLVHGQDVLAILPTGFGKSAIYQILVGVKKKMSKDCACDSWCPKGMRSVWGRSVKCLRLIAGVSFRRLTPSPYSLLSHSLAVFVPFASAWKRKGNGCYAG